MANRCPDCGIDLDKFGARHRCLRGKAQGQRQLTKLEKDRIAKGEMTAADLAPKVTPAATAQPGRLAKLTPADTRLAPVHRDSDGPRTPQPSLADVMAAIDRLTAQFEKLQATLTDKPRPDA
jgi:hypothetical protein